MFEYSIVDNSELRKVLSITFELLNVTVLLLKYILFKISSLHKDVYISVFEEIINLQITITKHEFNIKNEICQIIAIHFL